MRVVLDPNVLIAALLSAEATPALLFREWLTGRFELVISEAVLSEFRRACSYPKIAARLPEEAVVRFEGLLRESAELVEDPGRPAPRSPDPGDDYLLALAEVTGAFLVSGDRHLLSLAPNFPVLTPREGLDRLTRDAQA